MDQSSKTKKEDLLIKFGMYFNAWNDTFHLTMRTDDIKKEKGQIELEKLDEIMIQIKQLDHDLYKRLIKDYLS